MNAISLFRCTVAGTMSAALAFAAAHAEDAAPKPLDALVQTLGKI